MHNYKIKEHKSGDTVNPVQFTVLVNDLPIDLTGSSILMQTRVIETSEVIHEFSTTIDVFHLTKFIHLPCLFLAGYFCIELRWFEIAIMIMLRLIFFDSILKGIRDFR